MNYGNQNVTPPPYYGPMKSAVDRQANSVMRKVYFRMFVGLLISAFCALGVASSPAAMAFIFGNQIIFWGLFIVMLAMAFIIPARLTRMSTMTVLTLFAVFAAIMGIWLAPIFRVYNPYTIVYTFFITAGTFGAMSVYGYFTKTDLTKYGNYFMMALIGLIIAIVVNIFWANSTLEWVISIAGVLIFTGLTAWDTQMVRRLAQSNIDPQMSDKLATMGAMNLYLDFINLFLFILNIFNRD